LHHTLRPELCHIQCFLCSLQSSFCPLSSPLRVLITMSNRLILKLYSVLVSLNCQTLAEYLENKTWDYTSYARVVIMPGHHRVAQLFLVRLAFNFTLLGSTRVNHTPQDTRPILHIARIWFDNIINLNLTGIIVIKSDGLEASPFAALKFTRIFTLQVSQIAVHSPRGGIYMENVFGNSVIEHSSFRYGLTHISMHFFACRKIKVCNPLVTTCTPEELSSKCFCTRLHLQK